MTPAPSTVEAFPGVESPTPANGNHHLQVEESRSNGSEGEVWAWAWLLWDRRRFLARAVAWGLAVSVLVAFLIPKRYDSTTRLMPPAFHPILPPGTSVETVTCFTPGRRRASVLKAVSLLS